MGTFEVFDHTADVGLDVRGAGLEDLFETAARAMFSIVLVDLPQEVEVEEEVRVPIPSDPGDREELLVAWLQELLYHFEMRHLVPLAFVFHEKGPEALRVRVGFGRFEPGLHRTGQEIKAVTYHALEVAQQPDGTWSARVILDV